MKTFTIVVLTFGSFLALSGHAQSQEKKSEERPTLPRVLPIKRIPDRPITPIPGELTPVPQELKDVIVLTSVPPSRTALSIELYRQAAWIAAREEFGLRVLDAHLGERAPESLPLDRYVKYGTIASTAPSSWEFVVDNNVVWQHQILEKTGATFYGLSHLVIPGNDEMREDVKAVPIANMRRSEEASRGSLVKCFTAARFTPRPNRRSNALIPEDVEKLLNTMEATSQWAAVRRLHHEMQVKGESDSLVAGLVRGYANLALLTEYQWGGAPEVFQARSMLYAQRIVARSPESATALRHRAYASALVGFHVAAMFDLESAAKLKGADTVPWWTEALDAYLHFDLPRVIAARKAHDKPLVQFLEYLVHEDTVVKWYTSTIADRFLESHPDCYRVMHTYCYVIGSPYTNRWHRTMLEYIPRRLKELPDLPETVAKVLDEEKVSESRLDSSLFEAGDPRTDQGTPTWASLGKITQDNRFVQAFSTLTIYFRYSEERAEAARQAVTRLDGHPMLPLIQSFEINESEQPDEWKKRLLDFSALSVDDRSLAYKTVLQRLPGDRDLINRRISASVRRGATYQNQMQFLRSQKQVSWTAAPSHVGIMSPNCPEAAMMEILTAKPNQRFDEFEKRFAHSPAVLQLLANYYGNTRRIDDAIRCWKKRLEVYEDKDSLRSLALTYYNNQRMEEWVAMIEAILKRPDLAEGHDPLRVQLARYYMSKKDYKNAEAHSERAAEGDEPWALECAGDIKLALQKWDEANTYFKRLAQKNPAFTFDWYFVCRCHPQVRGLKDSQEAVLEFIGDLGKKIPQQLALRVARAYLLMDRVDDAIAVLEQWIKDLPNRQAYLFTALVMDQAGRKKERDHYLVKAIEHPNGVNGEWYEAKQFAIQIKKLVDDGESTNREKILAVLKETPQQSAANLSVLLGWYLRNHGDKAQAKDVIEKAMPSPYLSSWLRTHAMVHLLELPPNADKKP